jgi:hypothetical protein
VKRDLEMYGPLVREGGLVAFHDIAPNPTGSGGEVPRFWAEIKALHEHEEFVADWRRGYGIGVIKP